MVMMQSIKTGCYRNGYRKADSQQVPSFTLSTICGGGGVAHMAARGSVGGRHFPGLDGGNPLPGGGDNPFPSPGGGSSFPGRGYPAGGTPLLEQHGVYLLHRGRYCLLH